MALSRRERRHEQTRQEIKQIARQQMAKQGTAASLSIRGIAAEMGMSAPSLYNYYTNRDDLVTDLLVDSYTDQAEALEQASASCQGNDTVACLLTTLLAYRQWALEHPTEFALIAGTPVPGYVAPAEQTLPRARRGLKVIVDLMQRAWDEHLLTLQPGFADLAPETFNEDFAGWCREQGYAPPVVSLFLKCYAFLQGFIGLGVYGHLPFLLNDPVSFYRAALLRMLGLPHA
ncbi:MAG TPA: TetR/AcrR family transcriptional regulator [Ktedonobacterales bacterium]